MLPLMCPTRTPLARPRAHQIAAAALLTVILGSGSVVPMTIDGSRVNPGETVVLSEVQYLYKGVSSMIIADGMTLSAQFYLKPRKTDAVLRVRR